MQAALLEGITPLYAPPAEAGLYLLSALCLLVCALSSYWLSGLIAKQLPCKRSMLVYGALMIGYYFLPRALGLSGGVMVSSMLGFALLCAGIAFRQRGQALFALSLKLIASWLALEVICSFLMKPIMQRFNISQEQIVILTVQDFLNPIKIFWMFGFATLGQLLLAISLIVFRQAFRLLRENREHSLYVKVIVRMSALVLLGSWVIYSNVNSLMPYFQDPSFLTHNTQYIFQMTLTVGLFMVAASYLVQDVRYINQLQRCETLERQQEIAGSMLKNLRYFRHNMVNMLYGLEGVILSGDTEDIRNYYRDMERRCALVNNENIIALERITQSAISAVLLRAMDRAQEEELPFSLYVQEGFHPARRMSNGELCQVLGVLLDNALEAAIQTSEPAVMVEMRNVDGTLEVIVKNTYSGQINEAILCQGGQSTKAGHMGQGLLSCYELLKRKRNAFLNFDVSDQYVRAQLLMKM